MHGIRNCMPRTRVCVRVYVCLSYVTCGSRDWDWDWLAAWLRPGAQTGIVFAPVNWAPPPVEPLVTPPPQPLLTVGGRCEFINVWFGIQPTFSTQWQQTFTFCMLSALSIHSLESQTQQQHQQQQQLYHQQQEPRAATFLSLSQSIARFEVLGILICLRFLCCFSTFSCSACQ